MKLRSGILGVAILCVSVGCPQGIGSQAARAEIDEGSSEALVQEIQSAVTKAGGDFEKQNLHLIVSLSTGHFANDPIAAEAARKFATKIADSILVEGDRYSVLAWEFGNWNQPGSEFNPVMVSSDRSRMLQEFSAALPTTMRDRSVGGHDTERAIIDASLTPGSDNSSVVVLITNTAGSIASGEETPIGADSIEYQALLQGWNRIGASTESGASLELSYKAIPIDKPSVNRTLDAIIVTPSAFTGPNMDSGSRTEALQKKSTASTPQSQAPKVNTDFLTPILIVAGLGAVTLVIRLFRNTKGSAQGQRRIIQVGSLAKPITLSRQTESFRVVGQAYPDKKAHDITVELKTDQIIAIGQWDGKRIIVRGEDFKLVRVNGARQDDSVSLIEAEDVELEFEGSSKAPSGLPMKETYKAIFNLQNEGGR